MKSAKKKAMTIEDLAVEMNRKFEELGVIAEDTNTKVGLILEHTSSLRELPPKVDKIIQYL